MILPLDRVRRVAPAARLVVTSGGFDPLHVGHLRYLYDASRLGDILCVIVNGDGWLDRKKGFHVMSLADRMEIVDALRCVDIVTDWDDGTPTVCGALEILRPAIFAKGGDRSGPETIPEWQTCKELSCDVRVGVGGGKIRSSSDLVKGVTR